MPAEEVVFEQSVTDTPPVTETKEAPAEVNTEATADTAAPEPAKDEERDEKGRFKRPIQPRIDELTRAKHEAEREAAYWKGVAESSKPSAKVDAPAKPDAANFSDHNDYVEALAEWKADQRIEAALSKRDQESLQATQKAERETRASTWEQRQTEYAKTAPDYFEAMDGAEMRVPSHVLEALLESEQGPALAHHLAKNPEVVDRISRLSERQALLELGKIEGSLSHQKPALKSVTKAPAPITPVKSGGGNVVDLSKASQAEYEAHRKSQGAWWAR